MKNREKAIHSTLSLGGLHIRVVFIIYKRFKLFNSCDQILKQFNLGKAIMISGSTGTIIDKQSKKLKMEEISYSIPVAYAIVNDNS